MSGNTKIKNYYEEKIKKECVMCLVSIAPKGTPKDTEEVYAFIKKGFECNKDGSGYMYKRNGSKFITIMKGFFNLQELIDSIKAQKLKDDDELVIHHRISTAGLVSQENTHPFICSEDHEELKATVLVADKPCLAHNGMFTGLFKLEMLNPDFSDTYAFARYIMGDENIMKIYNTDPDKFSFLFDRFVGSSRVAILHPDKDLTILGKFVKDNGYLHSNSGYCTYVHNRGGSEDSNWKDWVNQSVESSTEKNKPSIPFKLDPALAKVLNTNPKYTLRRFDSRNVDLTSKNFHHFNYVKKSHYEAHKDKSKLKVYFLPSTLDLDSKNTSMQQITDAVYNVYTTEITDVLIHDYYYIPKIEYSAIYDDYYKLITSVTDIGKKTIKKLNKLLTNKHKSRPEDGLFYDKLGCFLSKASLVAFRDWLENAAKLVYNENVDDVEFEEDDQDNHLRFYEGLAITD